MAKNITPEQAYAEHRIRQGFGTSTDAILIWQHCLRLTKLCGQLHGFALPEIARGPAIPEWVKVMNQAEDLLGLEHHMPKDLMKE